MCVCVTILVRMGLMISPIDRDPKKAIRTVHHLSPAVRLRCGFPLQINQLEANGRVFLEATAFVERFRRESTRKAHI